MKISHANARSPSLSFGDYARNNLRKYPCSHRTQRETARLGMRISVTNTRSPSLSFGDYARNSCSQCSHRTQRETAQFGMRISFTNARSPSLSFGDYARNFSLHPKRILCGGNAQISLLKLNNPIFDSIHNHANTARNIELFEQFGPVSINGFFAFKHFVGDFLIRFFTTG